MRRSSSIPLYSEIVAQVMTIMASEVYLPEDVNLEVASVRLVRDMLACFGRAEAVA